MSLSQLFGKVLSHPRNRPTHPQSSFGYQNLTKNEHLKNIKMNMRKPENDRIPFNQFSKILKMRSMLRKTWKRKLHIFLAELRRLLPIHTSCEPIFRYRSVYTKPASYSSDGHKSSLVCSKAIHGHLTSIRWPFNTHHMANEWLNQLLHAKTIIYINILIN